MQAKRRGSLVETSLILFITMIVLLLFLVSFLTILRITSKKTLIDNATEKLYYDMEANGYIKDVDTVKAYYSDISGISVNVDTDHTSIGTRAAYGNPVYISIEFTLHTTYSIFPDYTYKVIRKGSAKW